VTTTIFREFTFEAAHQLPKVPANHKCATMHGHSYRVKILAEGEVNPDLGWFCDWGDIDYHAEDLRGHLDHKTLNTIAGLENPTCENLAAWIWAWLKPRFATLSKVVIYEGPRSGVEYVGPAAK
jgi:6-pyruvoyltetrahydropterin/6-carboxytetrahydropterin synthase